MVEAESLPPKLLITQQRFEGSSRESMSFVRVASKCHLDTKSAIMRASPAVRSPPWAATALADGASMGGAGIMGPRLERLLVLAELRGVGTEGGRGPLRWETRDMSS